jgi:hypothetical protein
VAPKILTRKEKNIMVIGTANSSTMGDQPMAKSKFNNQPGSIYTKQVDYDMRNAVFSSQTMASDKVRTAKSNVLKMKDAKKLGKKQEWNGSTQTIPYTQQRNKMRQLAVVCIVFHRF